MLWPVKLALRLLLLAVLALAVYFGVTFVQVWQASRHDGAQPAEAIVVFGAAQYDGRPSKVLRARLDHAVDLYDRRLAPYVVVTGGKAPGDRFTEAQASARYLLARGVPDSAILREVQGRNSWDSLAAAANFLRRRGIDEVILVSDPFHAKRIEGMAEELHLDAHTSPTRTSPIRGAAELRQMARETVAVGIARVTGYRRLMKVDRAVVRVRSGSESG